jgi:hypothetical protein
MVSGGSAVYRRNVPLEGAPAVQMRVLRQSGAMNFFELLVAKDATDALRINDFYDLSMGSLRSAEAGLALQSTLEGART